MTEIVKYVKESFEELRNYMLVGLVLMKVLNLTVLVAVFSIIFSLIIWGLDSVFSRLIKEFFNLIINIYVRKKILNGMLLGLLVVKKTRSKLILKMRFLRVGMQ